MPIQAPTPMIPHLVAKIFFPFINSSVSFLCVKIGTQTKMMPFSKCIFTQECSDGHRECKYNGWSSDD